MFPFGFSNSWPNIHYKCNCYNFLTVFIQYWMGNMINIQSCIVVSFKFLRNLSISTQWEIDCPDNLHQNDYIVHYTVYDKWHVQWACQPVKSKTPDSGHLSCFSNLCRPSCSITTVYLITFIPYTLHIWRKNMSSSFSHHVCFKSNAKIVRIKSTLKLRWECLHLTLIGILNKKLN